MEGKDGRGDGETRRRGEEIETQWLGRITYDAALVLQNQAVADYLDGSGPQRLYLLEHEPVYTIGRTRDVSSLREPDQLPHPVFETNRGGQATWHGPGQLVAYPILELQNRDLHAYMRFLEEVVIQTCKRYGVQATRQDGLTGVWVQNRKLASIGVGVRKWVTMHGLALNVEPQSLEAFTHITPCGISGVAMTCLATEANRPLTVKTVADDLADIFLKEFSRLAQDGPK